jgi:hypothetical protein
MLSAEDALSDEGARRLQRIESLFDPRPTANGSAAPGMEGNGHAGYASHS